MRTCPAGMGAGVCAFSAVAAANKKKQRTEKRKMARRCMVHTPGLIGESIFLWTLLHETPASGLRTFLRLYTGAPRIIAPVARLSRKHSGRVLRRLVVCPCRAFVFGIGAGRAERSRARERTRLLATVLARTNAPSGEGSR